MSLLLLLPVLAGAADPDWKQLRASEATASSFLVSNWNKYSENYHPSYVLDGDPRTAWVEGVDGNGEGQTLTIPVSRLASARSVKVRVRNGYQKSETLLTANAAPKHVILALVNDRGVRVASIETDLDRSMGWQDRIVPVPPGVAFEAVQLEIVSVHEGRTYKDTCISDVEVWVDGDVPYNAGAEAAKHAALTGWIAERVKTAAYFASQPATYPFAHTHYESQYAEVAPATVDGDLAGWRAKAEALAASPTWYSGAVSKRIEHLPDGTWGLDSLQDLFTPTELALFETDKEAGPHRPVDYDKGWYSETWHTNYKVKFAADDAKKPVAAWFKVKEVIEERGVTTTHTAWYVEWDAQGRLTAAYAYGTSEDDMEPATFEQKYTFDHDATGKVTTFQVLGRRTATYLYEEPAETVTTATVQKYFGS